MVTAGRSDATIPGFPEIIEYQYRCRLCRLAKTQGGLLRQIHDWRKEGLGDRPLTKKANDLIERHGVKQMDRRVFERHFSTHVDFSDTALMVASAFELPDPDQMQQFLGEDEIALMQADASNTDENGDYHHMWDIFRRLFRRIKALDADPTAFLGPEGGVSATKMAMWIRLVSEGRSTLEGLNRMRNNDRLVVAILEGHTKRLAVQLIDSVKAEFIPQIDLLRERGQEDLALAMEDTLRKRLPYVFRDAAIDSLQNSKEEYSLLH